MTKTPAPEIPTAEFDLIRESYIALRLAERRLQDEAEFFKQCSDDMREARERYRKRYQELLVAREVWKAHAKLKIPALEQLT